MKTIHVAPCLLEIGDPARGLGDHHVAVEGAAAEAGGGAGDVGADGGDDGGPEG